MARAVERTDPDLIAAFAAELRARRRAAGLSQEELAHRADLSVSTVSFLETRRRQPSLTVMRALARALGVSLAAFAGGVETRLE